ncbi:hypothetical protein FHS82_002663 [Pseudochelatococcus lubricantis]|uniref:Uncharacterized protein n=1 Tax=Pseudochelatococcus lubricantis TaxID=1538102 RepID=A0ABX0V0X6_9HYPH|nr:hypothetical protein [Pseudochelatococcus lubricantis]NIJ58808.1 hypothetical protein [Pseudochelatococcus lubricantis]
MIRLVRVPIKREETGEMAFTRSQSATFSAPPVDYRNFVDAAEIGTGMQTAWTASMVFTGSPKPTPSTFRADA